MSKKTRRREKKQAEIDSMKVEEATLLASKKTNKKEQRKVVTNRPTPSPEAVPAMTAPANPITAAPAASKGVVEPLCIIFLPICGATRFASASRKSPVHNQSEVQQLLAACTMLQVIQAAFLGFRSLIQFLLDITLPNEKPPQSQALATDSHQYSAEERNLELQRLLQTLNGQITTWGQGESYLLVLCCGMQPQVKTIPLDVTLRQASELINRGPLELINGRAFRVIPTEREWHGIPSAYQAVAARNRPSLRQQVRVMPAKGHGTNTNFQERTDSGDAKKLADASEQLAAQQPAKSGNQEEHQATVVKATIKKVTAKVLQAGSSGCAAAEKLPGLDIATQSDTIKNSSTLASKATQKSASSKALQACAFITVSAPSTVQEEVKCNGGAGADRGADEAASEDCGNMSTAEDVQLEGEVENLMRSLVSNLFEIVPKQAKDHQVVEATVVHFFNASALADESPASELALYMAVNYGDSPLLMHRLAARVVPGVLRGAFKKHEGFRAVLPFVGTTAMVYIGLQAWSFWEDQFLCLVEQGEVCAEAVIEAPGEYSELNLYLRPGAVIYSYVPPETLYMLELPQAARGPVISNTRKLSLTAAVRAIRKMLRCGMKKMSILAILSKSVYIAAVGTVVSGAIVYALLHCCGSRLKGNPAIKLVLEAPWGAVAIILLPINMACHMAANLAHNAGLRLQSVRQLLMQQAAIPPLFHLGILEPPEKRTSPTSGRIITLTAHAGGLPAAKSAGTSQSLLALPAQVATWGAKHAAQAAVVAAGGLRDAAVMSIMAADRTVRVASKHVEALIGHKVAQAADFDGYPLPACPASVGTFRAGVRMGYQVASALSAIPKGFFRSAVRLFSSYR